MTDTERIRFVSIDAQRSGSFVVLHITGKIEEKRVAFEIRLDKAFAMNVSDKIRAEVINDLPIDHPPVTPDR